RRLVHAAVVRRAGMDHSVQGAGRFCQARGRRQIAAMRCDPFEMQFAGRFIGTGQTGYGMTCFHERVRYRAADVARGACEKDVHNWKGTAPCTAKSFLIISKIRATWGNWARRLSPWRSRIPSAEI